MADAKPGDTVKVHYTGKLDDGTVFDSSEGRDPLEFTLGQGAVIPGFEAAVLGMEAGATKTETITSDEAYGPYQDNMLQVVEKSMLPDDLEIEAGKHLQVTRSDAPPIILTIVEFDDENVTLDANHPLAGKDLVFEIELVEIIQG
jgi:peptidylprolyl isomerase